MITSNLQLNLNIVPDSQDSQKTEPVIPSEELPDVIFVSEERLPDVIFVSETNDNLDEYLTNVQDRFSRIYDSLPLHMKERFKSTIIAELSSFTSGMEIYVPLWKKISPFHKIHSHFSHHTIELTIAKGVDKWKKCMKSEGFFFTYTLILKVFDLLYIIKV